jgi:hypothetical protein
MKQKTLLLLIIAFLFSCSENPSSIIPQDEITIRAKPNKIEICDYNPKSNKYRTRLVNEKNLSKILGEGDYVGSCEEGPACDLTCLFCNYVGLMDFDEPCPEIPFDGDVFCETFISAECPENPEAGTGQSYLWDRDLYRNQSSTCDTDDENDSGLIGVFWEIGCDGSLSGQVTVFYDSDGDDVFEVDLIDLAATEEAYNQALFCRSYIRDLATSLGMPNACEEE